MTIENKKLCDEMVAMAGVYKNSSEVMIVGNIMLKLLGKKQKLSINGKPLNFDCVILPRIVLIAIDIEILLKAIYLADNDKTTKGHDWKELFDSLSASRQQDIIESMPPEYRSDFNIYLDDNKDSFIKWRYAYESNGLNCNWSFVHEFANVLAGIAMKLTK